MTKVIGLTGGVASGKNFIADLFAKNGGVIFDADAEVHSLLERDDSTIAEVKKNFPSSFSNEKIDRKILGKITFGDAEKMKILEGIIHSKVREKYQLFLVQAIKEKQKLVILNIPLLLESETYKCDYIVAIIVDLDIREKRFIEREKLKNPQAAEAELKQRFAKILTKQTSNKKREEIADFVIKNHNSDDAEAAVKNILKSIS